MDGMYEDSPAYTDFADQCRQIEEFVKENYGGRLRGVYGISQGAMLMTELLARNNIVVEEAVLDGVYLAHQGKVAGHMAVFMLKKMQKSGGKIPKGAGIFLKLMGMTQEEADRMFDCIYWGVKEEDLRKNALENYTFHLNTDIVNSEAKVHLWCGSKEPYALKSHRIIKPYLKNYDEKIMEGLGHGVKFYFHSEELSGMLREVFRV